MNILRKIIMFLVGFCTYVTIEVIYKGGYSHWIMGLCGGLALIFLDELNNRISWNMDLLLQGIFGSIFITFLEFVIGSLSLKGILPVMWNYSSVPLNYHGIICLPFSLIWIGLSIIGIFVADAINYYVFEESPIPYYKIFGHIVLRFPTKKCSK